MRTRLTLLALLSSALVACSGETEKSPSTNTAAATEVPEKLSELARMTIAGKVEGFEADGDPTEFDDVKGWATYADDSAARLRKQGFVRGASFSLTNADGTPGIATGFQFRTAAAARQEVTHLVKTSGQKPFAVDGIPGARGTADNDGQNIEFSKGPRTFIVGTKIAGGKPTRDELVAAAKAQYDAAS